MVKSVCQSSKFYTGQHPVVCMPSIRMGSCGWRLFNSLVLVGLLWTTINLQEKMTKALAEFKFRRLGKHFMEPSDYDKMPLCMILYFVRGIGLLAE
jgi:hypothetical protein